MSDTDSPKDNRLIAALADSDWKRWQPRLERVDLKSGQTLHEPDTAQRYAYFPTSSIVSLAYLLGNGASTEIAVVGNEGMVGTSLFLGGTWTTHQGSVLIAGQGFRIDAQWIRDEFARSDSVRHLLLRYTQALMTQIAQIAVCNRHHTVDQQVCGWVLHILDRMRGNEVRLTQEVLASMLGVRRESVTAAAGLLQAAGLIRYVRGHISVLDRGGLERRACECHAIVKTEYDRLLPQRPAGRAADPARRVSPAWHGAAPIHLPQLHEVAAACED